MGIAIIDRDRPGHTFMEDMLRVSVVRCSTRPFDPCSDSGEISTCFRIVPYEGSFETSGVPAIAGEFHHPPIAWQAGYKIDSHNTNNNSSNNSNNSSDNGQCFMPLMLEGNGIVTSSFKVAENRDGYILRLYESLGKITKATVYLGKEFSNCKVYETNLLEGERKKMLIKNDKVEIVFAPFEIKTILFKTEGKIPRVKDYNHESIFWQEIKETSKNASVR
ncbi:MAG: hypothetical protein GX754_04915 [Clostridiaceae bacterium]|nr:hypothetical protein [Clostridiaceae bacterium]